MSRRSVLHRRSAHDADTTVDLTPDWPWLPVDEAPVEVMRVHVSGLALFGLIFGVVGLCATLTGLLAPQGFLLGALGLLAGFAGLVATRHPEINGRGVAGLGMLIGATAMALAVLALSGRYQWPNSHSDQIHVWHAWLVTHWSTLRRW
jgi:hypothetical protein